jgi:hypothetical protein
MWQKKSAVAQIIKQLHSIEIWNWKKGQLLKAPVVSCG